MHYFEDAQTREHCVTRDIATTYLSDVAMTLGFNDRAVPMFEVPKSLYGAEGDVDLLVYQRPGAEEEVLIACEIKTVYLTADGSLKSVKALKSSKQLERLRLDGFDYVWLLEFIVTEPAGSWLHPQAGDALLKETAIVECHKFGHAKFQICPIVGVPESDAGSIGVKLVRPASRLPITDKRNSLLEVIRPMAMRVGLSIPGCHGL